MTSRSIWHSASAQNVKDKGVLRLETTMTPYSHSEAMRGTLGPAVFRGERSRAEAKERERVEALARQEYLTAIMREWIRGWARWGGYLMMVGAPLLREVVFQIWISSFQAGRPNSLAIDEQANDVRRRWCHASTPLLPEFQSGDAPSRGPCRLQGSTQRMASTYIRRCVIYTPWPLGAARVQGLHR